MKLKDSIDNNLPKPFTLIIGGHDITSGLTTIQNNLSKADYFLIGGAVANTFLLAQGFDIGASDHFPEKLSQIREIMASADALNKQIILPVDVIVSDKADGKGETIDIPVEDIEGDMKILDLGVKTIVLFKQVLDKSNSVYWSGALGHYDVSSFKQTTNEIAGYLLKNDSITVVPNGEVVSGLLKK